MHTVLFVDDEPQILNALQRLLRREDYRVIIANSGREGLEILERENINLIVSDQRMPDMEGTDFLQKAKEKRPEAIRVILSGYADVAVIVDSINKGEIYRFLPKPWNAEELKISIRQCLEHHDILRQNRSLLEQTRLQNEKLSLLNENLEDLVETRTQSLKLSQDILECLPVGVIGVSRDMEIVLVNEMAVDTIETLRNLIPGTDAESVLPEEACCAIASCLNGEAVNRQVKIRWNGSELIFNFKPLGDSGARGCIIVIQKAAT